MSMLMRRPRPVKPTNYVFGSGLFRSLPVDHEPYTAADLAWLAEDNARREAFDRYVDRLGAEATAVGALERGLMPRDLADYLAASSVVGHDA